MRLLESVQFFYRKFLHFLNTKSRRFSPSTSYHLSVLIHYTNEISNFVSVAAAICSSMEIVGLTDPFSIRPIVD